MLTRDTITEMHKVSFFELFLYSWGSTAFTSNNLQLFAEGQAYCNSSVICHLKLASKVKRLWKSQLIWTAVVRHKKKSKHCSFNLHLKSYFQFSPTKTWLNTHPLPSRPTSGFYETLNLNQVLLPSHGRDVQHFFWKVSSEISPSLLLSTSWPTIKSFPFWQLIVG